MKRIVALVLTLVVAVAFFTGCKPKEEVPQGSKTIVIDGVTINSKVYDYYLYYEKMNNPDAPQAELEAAAVKQTVRHKFITDKANEMGKVLTDEERSSIQLQIDSQIQQYGSREAFDSAIAKMGLDYDSYKYLMENSYLEQLIESEFDKLYTDEQRKDYFNNNMMLVHHILFMTVDDMQNPLDEQTVAQKKADAQSVLAKAQGGADFMALVKEYNEDPGSGETGYLVDKYTSFVKPFLDASLELEVGGISPIVETSYGYHIIKRVEHKGNTTLYEDNILSVNKGLFNDEFDKWYAERDIVVE